LNITAGLLGGEIFLRHEHQTHRQNGVCVRCFGR